MRLTVFSVSYTDFVCQYRFCEVFVNCFPRVTHYNAITAYCQGDSIFYVCRFFSSRKSASFSLTSLVIPLFFVCAEGKLFCLLAWVAEGEPQTANSCFRLLCSPNLLYFSALRIRVFQGLIGFSVYSKPAFSTELSESGYFFGFECCFTLEITKCGYRL